MFKQLLHCKNQLRPKKLSLPSPADDDLGFYCERDFIRLLRLEQKRVTRSQRPILLIRLDVANLLENPQSGSMLREIAAVLGQCFRETDLIGWYKKYSVIGVILTEIAQLDDTTLNLISEKIQNGLCKAMGPEGAKAIQVSFETIDL